MGRVSEPITPSSHTARPDKQTKATPLIGPNQLDNRPQKEIHDQLHIGVNNSARVQSLVQLQAMANHFMASRGGLIQRKNERPATTHPKGLPEPLRQGIEQLSGYAMDDVNVHYHSAKPSQLHAHAFAQGTDIHLAPGQERHLPHEAWHVVQQKQGRVKPTLQMKSGVQVNDDRGLEKEADVMGARANQLQVSEERPQLIHQTPGTQPVQRMIAVSELANILLTQRSLDQLTDNQRDAVLYWNTRNVFDGLRDPQRTNKILEYATRDFDNEFDDEKRLPGQTNPRMNLPIFMLDHHEFDLPLPRGIGTLSFRHGHQYVLGTYNNKWISNNIRWEGRNSEGQRFSYLIHVILQFSDKVDGRWVVDPHVTIRNTQAQLVQTGIAMISEPNRKRQEKKSNPEREATQASYSLGLGENKRNPGINMGALPDEYINDIFQPWLLMVKNRAVFLNQIEPESIVNRRLWLELAPQYGELAAW
ncbi:MAG: DUF4157 domain-containing protein [Bacteroidota bacterium]